MSDLTQAEIMKVLRYDPRTGFLYWLERHPDDFDMLPNIIRGWNTRYAGKRALTTLNNHGYLHGTIFGKTYTAHRVIWVICTGYWPEEGIDHTNQDRTDNRIGNLREVTSSQNSQNTSLRSDNTSGTAGVNYNIATDKWLARICINGTHTHLGLFETLDEAVSARKNAEREHGYSLGHGSQPNNQSLEDAYRKGVLEEHLAANPLPELLSSACGGDSNV